MASSHLSVFFYVRSCFTLSLGVRKEVQYIFSIIQLNHWLSQNHSYLYNMYVLSTIRKYFIALTKFSSIRNRRDWHAPRKKHLFLAGQGIITWDYQLGSWLDDRPAKGRATGLIEKGKGSKSSLGRTLAQTSRGPNGGRLFSGWLVRY